MRLSFGLPLYNEHANFCKLNVFTLYTVMEVVTQGDPTAWHPAQVKLEQD